MIQSFEQIREQKIMVSHEALKNSIDQNLISREEEQLLVEKTLAILRVVHKKDFADAYKNYIKEYVRKQGVDNENI